ncbi:hypothetical protein [Mucilaginibacter sp.]|uniref:hypothetical protein n=1 Tax=Mucilaginibacter sp. TaxID=1882438 RepID=UPI003D0D9EFF
MRKWPFVLLATVVILSAAGYYYYSKFLASNRWKPILQQELKDLVLRSTDSLYHIEYSDFDLNITSGDASVYNFKLIPDTNVYNKLVASHKAPDNLFILSVKKLAIKNVGARKAYKEKILNIDNIDIEKPDLTIINKRYKFNDTVKVGKPKTPYEIIKKTFKQLHIDSISLKDISLNYINKSHPVVKQTALKHLDINISDIVIDSLSDKDPSRFYYTKGVDVTVHDYSILTPDGLYKADLKRIFFSTAQRKIVLDKVSFVPRYNRTDFYKVSGTAGDIYTLKFKRIDINDIDLQSFLRDQVLYAGVMDINNPDVQIYTNNAYKGKKTSKIGKDPHQALQNVALDMKLKRLNIKNANINYSETDATSGATGEIIFKHTNGYILNVTNDDDQKKINPYMQAYINTRFMDAANLQVNFKFNLIAKNGAFNYSGELGSFDGRKLDKLVKPLALVHVESADIDKLTFNVDASNYAGKGHLEFYYRNLKVDLLKKVAGKPGLQKQGFISMLANKLIIEDNNPDKKGVFRPGPIDLQRDPTVSFFSFLYKGLLDGLKPSVGFDKKTESKVNTAIVKVSNLLDKFNKFKEDRKQRRETRRAKRDSVRAVKDSLKKLKKKNEGN